MKSPPDALKEWVKPDASYVGALVAVITFIPMPLFFLTVLIYFSIGYSQLGLPWNLPASVVLLGLGFTIVVLFVLSFFFKPLATAKRGKSSDYERIKGDLQVLEAQLVDKANLRKGCIAQSPKELECLTIIEIEKNIAYLNTQLTQSGMTWVLRTGYIRLWDRINKIVEAMIDILPRELVIESALHAIAQLTGSTIPSNEFRIDQLKTAIGILRKDPSGSPGQSHLILGTSSASCIITSRLTKPCCIHALYKALENLDAIALSGSPTDLVEEQKARSDIRQILYIIHTYRCERWEGLVHACNQLLGAAWLASWLLYVLFVVAIFAQVPVDTMYQISVFLLLGAIIGLFGRLLNEVYPKDAEIAHMDDYGLTVARILVTPLLSSLAVLVGVPLAVIALAMLQGGQSAANLPYLLRHCYDFFTYPGNLLIAGIFGYLPSTVISLLKQQANRSQSELLSSNATK